MCIRDRFNVMHHMSSLPFALANLCWFHWRGIVKVHEQIETGGVDAFPQALQKMFSGGHCGKLLVQVDAKQV